MTSPFDDAVVSDFQINLDFRADSVRSLEEVTDLLSKSRTQAEALSRASSDVADHLREAAATPPTMVTDQAQGGLAFGGGGSSTGGSDTRVVPEALGREVETSDGSGTEPITDRLESSPATLSEIDDRLEELNKKDPQRLENMRAARGNQVPREGLPDSPASGLGDRITSQVEGFSTLAQNILSETRPGASISQTLSTAAGGLSGLAGNSRIAGLLGAGGLSTLGIAGGALTAGLAANAAVQAGGQQIQSYANMGSVQGGGAGQGFEYEMQIRSLAMNPFLTTEQSRQIIMSGLSQGYTGKELDTVTDFMAENLKDMNLQVSQSTQILKKNVEEGGQSIQQLSMDLGMLKSSTRGGVLSLEERTQMYQQTASGLIDQGIGGGEASSMSLNAVELFEDNRQLSGVFSEVIANPSDSLVMQAGRSAGFREGTPYQMRMALGNSGELLSASYELVRKHALRINSRNASQDKKRELFYRTLGQLGITLSPNDANALFDEMIKEENANRVEESQQQMEEESYGVQDDSSLVGQGLSELGAFGGLALNAVGDTLGMLDLGWGDDETFASNFSKAYDSTGQAYQKWRGTVASNSSDGKIAMLDELNQRAGANNVDFVDSKGKRVSQTGAFSGGLSREDMEKISTGELKVSINGRDPVALRDVRGAMTEGEDFGMSTGGSTDGKVSVEVSATPELQRLLNFNTRTMNQENADHGWGTATRNNPPPADR